jgi:hypothetical protein
VTAFLFWLRVVRLREKAWQWVAWRVPRALAYWCGIRLLAHATTGPKFGSTKGVELTACEMLERWALDERGNLRR